MKEAVEEERVQVVEEVVKEVVEEEKVQVVEEEV